MEFKWVSTTQSPKAFRPARLRSYGSKDEEEARYKLWRASFFETNLWRVGVELSIDHGGLKWFKVCTPSQNGGKSWLNHVVYITMALRWFDHGLNML